MIFRRPLSHPRIVHIKLVSQLRIIDLTSEGRRIIPDALGAKEPLFGTIE